MKDQQLCEHCGYNQFYVSETLKGKFRVAIYIVCARCEKTYRDEDMILSRRPKREGEEINKCKECSVEIDTYLHHKHWCSFAKFQKALEQANDDDVVPIPKVNCAGSVRTFSSGATRHADDKKYDYEGFLSPWAIRRYGEYMHAHRVQADGTKRDSDNWQKGIPIDQYMKSLLRHVFDVHSIHRGLKTFDTKDGEEIGIEDALCGVIFNAFGFLHERLKAIDDLFVGLLKNHHQKVNK